MLFEDGVINKPSYFRWTPWGASHGAPTTPEGADAAPKCHTERDSPHAHYETERKHIVHKDMIQPLCFLLGHNDPKITQELRTTHI